MEHHIAAAQENVAARPDALIYHVERPVYDEGHVRSQLLHRRERLRPTLRQRLARHVQCSTERAKAAVLSFLPILAWLPSYPLKRYLFGDVVSGLSTGIMQLPQGLAYAMLAAVPPVYGLYSSFYPVLLYTFFGTSRHISMGTFAVISLMIGGVVVREAPDSMFCIQEAANGTCAVLDLEARDAARVQLAVALTALVGVIQLVLGLLRFGFVAVYLAEPLVRGFTTAAAVHVFVSQLKYLLGVEAPRFAGPFSALRSVAAVFGDIASTNVTALAVGLTCIVLLYGVKDVNERLKKTLPVPIPGEMIIVIVTTGISYGVGLSDNYGVGVVGMIPAGLLPPAVPRFSLLPNLVTDSFAIAIVGFSMDISLAKIFALKHGYRVDGNQELIALGLCNFIGCFFQTFAVTCSMSRSLVQESTGGNTQIAGLLASLVVLLVVVAVGFIFEPLPQTVLAAIIMVNLLGMFKQIRDVPALWRTSKIELAIWLVAFVASVLLGLDYGLLVAVGFAVSTVIYRTQSPKSAILGQVTDTGLYCDVAKYEEAAECPGIKIFHSNSSIYFANSELYVNDLKAKTGVHPTHLQAVRRDLKKRNHIGDSPQEKDAEVKLEMDAGAEGHENGQDETRAESDPKEDHRFPEPLTASIHSIILDWTPVNFMDSVGAKSIRNVIGEYAGVGVQVFIAGCSRTLLSELGTLQFFSGAVTPEMVFPTVHDAVLHSQQRTRPDANHCIV